MRYDTQYAGEVWTARSVASAAFFVLFILIQTGVPLVGLWAQRPARFGWQMFSAKPQPTRFTLIMHDGTRRPANVALYVAQSRGEMKLEEALPAHLCRVVPDVASVHISTLDSEQPRVCKCP